MRLIMDADAGTSETAIIKYLTNLYIDHPDAESF